MLPVKFDGSNCCLKAPSVGSVTVNNVSELHTFYSTEPGIGSFHVSAWDLTDEEVADIVKTKRVWLMVMGAGHPPVGIGTTCPIVF